MVNAFVDDVVVGEDKAFVDVTIRLDQADVNPATVEYYVGAGTAGGNDYDPQDSLVTFAPGETVKTVRIVLNPDALVEGDEAFYLVLNGSSANVTIADRFAEVRIIDNDGLSGTPNVSVADMVVDEAQGTATFVITLDRPSASQVTMNYATQNGTAKSGSDFVATSGNLVFAAGEVVKTVTVDLLNDNAQEGDQSFGFKLSNLGGATSLVPKGNATIAANDSPAVLQSNVTVDNVVVGEDKTYVDVTLRLDHPNAAQATVDYYVGAGTAGGNDYAPQDSFVTFAAGETVKTVRVLLKPDALVEGNEAFYVVLNGSSANVNIADPFGQVLIVDNDGLAGTPNVAVSDILIDEAQGTATFVVTLDRPSTGPVSMNFATQNGTAKSGSDYVATSGKLVFTSGEVVKTVTVDILDDGAKEINEDFVLKLTNLSGATSLVPQATATIAANDAPEVLQSNVIVEDAVVSEDKTYVDVTIRLDAPNTAAARVDYYVGAGTAGGNDYDPQDSFVTFAPGEMVKTVRVTLNPDFVTEGDEAFYLVLNGSSANVNIADPFAEVRIVDNDAPSGTPNVSVSSLVVNEGEGTATFVVTLDRPSVGAVSMNYATQDVNAVAGQDYEAKAGKLVFASGEVSKTVTVNILDDGAKEGNEAFLLYLSNFSGANGPLPVGSATIWANDSGGALNSSVVVDDIAVGEDKTYVDVTLRLDQPNAAAARVDYYVGAGTAGGNDYAPQDSFVTFAPGEIVKTVRVVLKPDFTTEGNEVFYLHLNGSSANVTIADPFAEITIVEPNLPRGTTGNDILDGTELDDTILGFDGNDKIRGFGGDDILIGGNGKDNIDGGNGTDVLIGGNGDDTLKGGNGKDTLVGEGGSDSLDGGTGGDIMWGGGGDDFYRVDHIEDVVSELLGEGHDTIRSSVDYTLGANQEDLVLLGKASIGIGNLLNNQITASANVASFIEGQAGLDILIGGDKDDRIFGGGQSDRIKGGSGDDKLYGDKGTDRLLGQGGNDRIEGGLGRDYIEGGSGQDLMTGGFKSDTFAFADGHFAGTSASTADRITDFNIAEGDLIDLSAVDGNSGLGGDQSFDFIGTDSFGGTAGELRYAQIGGNTYIQGDTDGDGTLDFAIRLDGTISVVEGMFVL